MTVSTHLNLTTAQDYMMAVSEHCGHVANRYMGVREEGLKPSMVAYRYYHLRLHAVKANEYVKIMRDRFPGDTLTRQARTIALEAQKLAAQTEIYTVERLQAVPHGTIVEYWPGTGDVRDHAPVIG